MNALPCVLKGGKKVSTDAPLNIAATLEAELPKSSLK